MINPFYRRANCRMKKLKDFKDHIISGRARFKVSEIVSRRHSANHHTVLRTAVPHLNSFLPVSDT